jgi:uncharacterized protein
MSHNEPQFRKNEFGATFRQFRSSIAFSREGIYKTAMRLTRALLIYVLVVFVGGALLAPLLYDVGHGIAALAKHPFHRYVDRAVLGLALIGLWPLMRTIGITSLAELGFRNASEKWRDIVPGLLLGLCSLAVIAILAIATGARHLHVPTGTEIARHLISAGAAAAIVAMLEEVLFRGALFGAMRKAWPLAAALVISSAIYSLMHFTQKAPEPTIVTWSSGLTMLPQMFAQVADTHAVVPKFFVLFVAGLILAIAYQRTGTLFFSIGLHAGWIFWLKSYRFVSTPVPGASASFWGTDELINGWASLVVLIGVLVFVDRMYRPKLATTVAPQT